MKENFGKISRNYLNELENQSITDNDNSEEIYKVYKYL